jgi:hypothetical protein
MQTRLAMATIYCLMYSSGFFLNDIRCLQVIVQQRIFAGYTVCTLSKYDTHFLTVSVLIITDTDLILDFLHCVDMEDVASVFLGRNL